MSVLQAPWVWFDGQLVSWDEARVPILTHALHYGTGVFEGIRAYAGAGNLWVFRLREHFQRLARSARMCFLESRYSVEELMEATIALLRRNEFRTQVYIRPIIFVGHGGINIDFRRYPLHTAIAAFAFQQYFEGKQAPGLRVCVSSYRRFHSGVMPAIAKATGNYLNSVMAKVEAGMHGYDEALMLDDQGHVAEGTGENVFLVRDGTIATPPLGDPILEGITRSTVLTLARDLQVPLVERQITRHELYGADEVFLAGTAAEISAVVEVDGRRIGDGTEGSATRRLREAYQAAVDGRGPAHAAWRTPVYATATIRMPDGT